MANDYVPRPAARFHARQKNFVTYVNGHLAHDPVRRPGHADTQGCSVGAPYPTNGVPGAEIRGRVAWASRPRTCDPPPTGPSELRFLSMDTRTPYVVNYPAEGVGKTAHYVLRWVSTTRDKGPWSETASATIGA